MEMKRRTRIALFAASALAILALAGCDAMLESIYPNETNPSNTLTVTVYMDYNSVSTDIYQGPLTIVLYKDGETYATLTADVYYEGSRWIEYYYTFTGLPKGTYTAYCWIDYNNDGDTTGDCDYGYYWPAEQGDGTQSVYLSGGASGNFTEYIYYYDYQYKWLP
jgi:hypothetical protein